MNLFNVSLVELQDKISEKIQQLGYVPCMQPAYSDGIVYSGCGSGGCVASCVGGCSGGLYDECLLF